MMFWRVYSDGRVIRIWRKFKQAFESSLRGAVR
jgi:hypothetical protein